MAIPRPLRLGTRKSKLALWQAHHVQRILERVGHEVELLEVTTEGDRILDVPLAEIGSKALFTKELDQALLEGRIHLAVHSLKDLPTTLPEGLALAAITHRDEPWDAFVAHPDYTDAFKDLPDGATLATSSLRRKAQLLAWRSDLNVVPVRGNVDTRLRKLDESEWEGMILASAGLMRLDLGDRIAERVPPELMLPAVGQGALGVTTPADQEDVTQMVRDLLNHEPSAAGCSAERAFLRTLEGGCQVPIGAWGHAAASIVQLQGCIASLDGSEVVRGDVTGLIEDPDGLGEQLADELLDQGGREILDAVRAEST